MRSPNALRAEREQRLRAKDEAQDRVNAIRTAKADAQAALAAGDLRAFRAALLRVQLLG